MTDDKSTFSVRTAVLIGVMIILAAATTYLNWPREEAPEQQQQPGFIVMQNGQVPGQPVAPRQDQAPADNNAPGFAAPIPVGPPFREPAEGAAVTDDVRRSAWELVLLLERQVAAGNRETFPAGHEWLADFHAATSSIDRSQPSRQWPALDVDALASRNPRFWRAYYEFVPADPGASLLHAALLMSAGEAELAMISALAAGQGAEMPDGFRAFYSLLLQDVQRGLKPSVDLMTAGQRHFESRNFDAAVASQQKAIEAWPWHSAAHFEYGRSLWSRDQFKNDARGNLAALLNPAPSSTSKMSPETEAAFASARKHNPFLLTAYLGTDAKLASQAATLARAYGDWNSILIAGPWNEGVANQQVDPAVLDRLSVACQQASLDDLALLFRQAYVSRRGGYQKSDVAFIAASLSRLTDVACAQAISEKLSAEELQLRTLKRP